MIPGQFMGAQPPGAATFAPIGAFGGPMAPGGFGDPFGGPMGPGGFGDPFGGPMGPGGFGDPFFGPMGPGGFDGAYNENAPVEDYYFEDPSLYDDYIPFGEEYEAYELGGESGSGSGSGSTTFIGSNNADTLSKATETTAWRFEGYSGADVFIGGSGDDIFWGAIGSDTLTGNAGFDTFYFSDFTEGSDTINDFVVGNTGDVLAFGSGLAGPYARDASVVTDNGIYGSTYNMTTNSNVLPKVFNFATAFATASSTTGVVNQLTNFKVTTDGSTPISNSSDFIIVAGSASPTNAYVYAWSDSGNGVIDNGELFSLATMSGVDNDNMTAANFAFGVI
jgi:hypothetical protein